MKVEVVIIDPQEDFCTPNGKRGPDVKTGALLVPGAYDDMAVRAPAWIRKHINKINRIRVSLDKHHRVDIAHKHFWRDSKGNKPLALGEAIAAGLPPTIITAEDQRKGVWRPWIPSLMDHIPGRKTLGTIAYCEALEKNGQFPLIIWDDHCIIETPGAAIVPELQAALDEWCIERGATIDPLIKGSNIWTEHYGAFGAEVTDPDDPTSGINYDLLRAIESEADMIIWMGEAATHCVMTSMKQAFKIFGPDGIKKSILFTDCMSCIPHPQNVFVNAFNSFLDEYKAKGLQVATSTNFVL
jgi:nicotinamidase-related amidase